MSTLDQWGHDLRLAGRGLLRARGFTGTAVLTLALGIAGTTVMFALIDGVLLRPLPVREPQRLLVAWKDLASGRFDHWPFQPVRLIGFTAERLTRGPGQMDLFVDREHERQKKLDAVSDQINRRFGKRSIRRGGPT